MSAFSLAVRLRCVDRAAVCSVRLLIAVGRKRAAGELHVCRRRRVRAGWACRCRSRFMYVAIVAMGFGLGIARRRYASVFGSRDAYAGEGRSRHRAVAAAADRKPDAGQLLVPVLASLLPRRPAIGGVFSSLPGSAQAASAYIAAAGSSAAAATQLYLLNYMLPVI